MNSSFLPVTEFVLVGLKSLQEKQIILFVIFLFAYITILTGNSMIIFLVRRDPKLNSPMYFFLHNLSFVDIVYTSITIPNMLSGFLVTSKTISVTGCYLQMYCFLSMASTGRGLLTVMAYDRYIAICNPLRYTAIMTKSVQVLLVIAAWCFGYIMISPAVILAARLPFCGPNKVEHCFCDLSSVIKLACADIKLTSTVSLTNALIILISTLFLIALSYILIGICIFKTTSSQGRWKAFSTCAAHLTVVLISYTSAAFVYISYRVGNISPEVRIMMAVLYSVLTPLLNPMIYSLRNKDLRDAAKRAFRKRWIIPAEKSIIPTIT
ncbi:olfactory receptor 5J3-like [Amia ocellicauda]|uniref:olfactory receptor 5J3-like n=1 Tax=Amia ocellicauda TaxID=2972642 RepID=UPI003464C9A1